ncbi:ArsR family transcriptional regulator [Deltaproteobacteria bacterium]|nr:ArsR family transcriptional regulator [Deltaproteobacteria bacterium]
MSPSRRFKDEVFEQFARIGKAVASPKRLELLDILCQGPRTVEVLADQACLSLANASQHLQVLRASRLIEAEKGGLYVTYRLAPGVEGFYLGLRGLAESRLAEVEATTRAFLAARGALEAVDAAEVLRRALSGAVTVLDVRPVEEFQAGHLPNARSVPLAELRARLTELPRDREVVAYCRGPYCVLAIEAVRVLREEGFTALRLDTGPPDWRAAGVALAAGP